jgi:hypothetical protein
LGSEHRLGEVQIEASFEVLASRRASWAALLLGEPAVEEGIEQVAEPTATAERIASATTTRLIAKAVVVRPPVGVAQGFIGTSDALELVFSRRIIGIGIWVELSSLSPIGLLDVICAGVAGNTEQFVEILRHCSAEATGAGVEATDSTRTHGAAEAEAVDLFIKQRRRQRPDIDGSPIGIVDHLGCLQRLVSRQRDAQ